VNRALIAVDRRLAAGPGVSSPQLDDPARGFHCAWTETAGHADGPGRRALRGHAGRVDQGELRRVAAQYAMAVCFIDANAIVARQSQAGLGAPLSLPRSWRVRSPSRTARTPTSIRRAHFHQALRIFIIKSLRIGADLESSLVRHGAGSRLVVISFHSLEDPHRQAVHRAQAHPGSRTAPVPLRAAVCRPRCASDCPRARRCPRDRGTPELARPCCACRAHRRTAAAG